jgi:hypothetical protein
MNGRDLYKSTFDEVKVSNEMMAKLMLLNGTPLIQTKNVGPVYRIVSAILTFLGVLAASGAFYSVPLG